MSRALIVDSNILLKPLITHGAGGGGNIRSTPATDTTEAHIGFYKYSDEGAADANDMWVAGVNCWARSVFPTWTPATQRMLNYKK
jgi:hypothetical protein